jgi:hypothetical protein
MTSNRGDQVIAQGRRLFGYRLSRARNGATSSFPRLLHRVVSEVVLEPYAGRRLVLVE